MRTHKGVHEVCIPGAWASLYMFLYLYVYESYRKPEVQNSYRSYSFDRVYQILILHFSCRNPFCHGRLRRYRGLYDKSFQVSRRMNRLIPNHSQFSSLLAVTASMPAQLSSGKQFTHNLPSRSISKRSSSTISMLTKGSYTT